MKLSELSTDRAADVLCELTPHISNIATDNELVETLGKTMNPGEDMNMYGKFTLLTGRVAEIVPMLLKTHRADVFGILSVMNERTVAEIASQKLMDTMRQVRELVQDEDFAAFFKSFKPQSETEQFAHSASSLTSA